MKSLLHRLQQFLTGVWSRVKQFVTDWSMVIFLGLLIAISSASVWLTFNYFHTFSAFAASLAVFSVMLVLGVLTDRFLLPGINTLEEIKNGNTAVAVTILAVAVLFMACVNFV